LPIDDVENILNLHTLLTAERPSAKYRLHSRKRDKIEQLRRPCDRPPSYLSLLRYRISIAFIFGLSRTRFSRSRSDQGRRQDEGGNARSYTAGHRSTSGKFLRT